jgi:CRP-like cAMP-binding protein
MDDHASVIAVLENAWFGAGSGTEFAPPTRERLAGFGTLQAIEADKILDEGEEAIEMGTLFSGRLAQSTLFSVRGPVTILSIEPGDIFGSSAALGQTKVQSRVAATEACEVPVIDGARLSAARKEDRALTAITLLMAS